MITLRRLDLIRKDSPATAEELASLQTQLNAHLFTNVTAHVTATPHVLPVEPSGYLDIEIRGRHFVLPFYAKG